jgi:hypothetical protein
MMPHLLLADTFAALNTLMKMTILAYLIMKTGLLMGFLG